jgi:hypothetical protein
LHCEVKINLKHIACVIQGDSSREKEIQEKYKEGETEPEESRYEKKYKRKIESLCQGE